MIPKAEMHRVTEEVEQTVCKRSTWTIKKKDNYVCITESIRLDEAANQYKVCEAFKQNLLSKLIL